MFDPWGRLVPLASSIIIKSRYWALLTTEQSLSGDGCLRGTSVNQGLVQVLLHFHLQSTAKKHMTLISWHLAAVLELVKVCMQVCWCTHALRNNKHRIFLYSLCHSSYPYRDFHMPVTDGIPMPALLKLKLQAKTGKWASWRRGFWSQEECKH